MKIRAIRLKDVGMFREPVAIEGLSGRVDVLAGPNELGKSTIYRAIEAGFLQKHTTTSFGGIRPRTGGEPLIEIDFEAQGGSWRILKRFSEGRGRLAELTDLTSGQLRAKGAEADERLSELIAYGGNSAGRFGLLWIGQDTALVRRGLKDAEQSALQSAIEAEITAVAGGVELSRVRRRVSDLLDEQTTRANRARPKAHSPYALALSHRKDIEAALTAARAAEQAMTASLDELESLRTRQQALGSSTAEIQLADAVAGAEQQLADARKAQALHSEAHARAADARLARDALTAFDKQLADLTELTESAHADQVRLDALTPASAGAGDAAQRAATDHHQLTEQEQQHQDLFRARTQFDAAAARCRLRDEAVQKLAQARKLESVITGLAHDLAHHPTTADRMQTLEREERAIAALDARLIAAQPTVSVDYVPGGDGAVRSEGRAVPGGRAITVDGVLVLEIAGVGSIRIAAGGGADSNRDRIDLGKGRESLARLLEQCGVPDVDAARKANAARQSIAHDLEGARARLAALAPDGIDAMAAVVHDLELALPSEVAIEPPPRAEIEDSIASVRAELSQSRRKAEGLAKVAGDLRDQVHGLAGAIATRAQQQQSIARALPPASMHGEARARLAATLEKAEAAAATAERAARLLAAAAPGEQEIAGLAAQRTAAEAAFKRRGDEIQGLARGIERLEGELEESFKVGGGRRVKELEGELQRANAAVRSLEDVLDALRLLDAELGNTERAQRDLYLKPVTDQLAPYLAELFPSASVTFDDKLGATTLLRNGVAEPVSQLSGGTHEQVSVLVRLAFGRLLAEAGFPTPLILDDALVYSDDDRIARMFHVIEQAAVSHQVIVLTCRSQVFSRLGGTELKLEPWNAR